MAMIQGKPMIQHVFERAKGANLGSVIVATPDLEIQETIETLGGQAILTSAKHPTGTDRVFEALQKFDPNGKHDIIINIQGDLPNLDVQNLARILEPFHNPEVDITTLAVPIRRQEDASNPNIVKIALEPYSKHLARALYFSRATIPGLKPLSDFDAQYYYHVGIYAYQRKALEKFVKLPESHLERTEGLEQLRALAAGLRIDVAFLDDVPISVDTPEDLVRARRHFDRKQEV
jgi:3-deoxy-manno-octulosonate cytidylyltransferase (CMP-KDO synthetase)